LRGARILVVDDDEETLEVLESLLRSEGFAVSTASGGEAALAEATRALPDVVLTDLQMQPIDGAELCRRLHQIDDDLPVIVVTGSSAARSVIESLRAGAQDYLIKPLDCDTVLLSVERAIARRTSKLKQAALYRTLNERLVLSTIREQEHSEGEARQRAQLNTLLENLKEGVLIADASGRVLMTNGAARAILGFGDEDLSSVTALNSVEAHDLEGRPLRPEEHPLMRALQGEHFMEYEVLRIRSNGAVSCRRAQA
jgi:PAS domain S-box-containing protein